MIEIEDMNGGTEMERLTEHQNGMVIVPTGINIMDIFKRLAAYEDTGLTPEEIPRWVPVGERLPVESEYRDKSTGELVPLLVCVKGTEYPFRAMYDGKSWGDGWSRIAVTHWMALPKAPKEAAEAEKERRKINDIT